MNLAMPRVETLHIPGQPVQVAIVVPRHLARAIEDALETLLDQSPELRHASPGLQELNQLLGSL